MYFFFLSIFGPIKVYGKLECQLIISYGIKTKSAHSFHISHTNYTSKFSHKPPLSQNAKLLPVGVNLEL